MKYKVGDIVKIKKCKVGDRYGAWNFTKRMKKYIGKKTNIVSIESDYIRLKIDKQFSFWTDEMLEPVKEKKEKVLVYQQFICPKCGRIFGQSNVTKKEFERFIKENHECKSKPKSLDELEKNELDKRVEILEKRYRYTIEVLEKKNKLLLEQLCLKHLSEPIIFEIKYWGYKPCPPPQETLEINGKTYLKDEVLEAVKNLKEIKN